MRFFAQNTVLLVTFYFYERDVLYFNMSKATVQVMMNPTLISYNAEISAVIFIVTDDRKGLVYLLSKPSLE